MEASSNYRNQIYYPFISWEHAKTIYKIIKKFNESKEQNNNFDTDISHSSDYIFASSCPSIDIEYTIDEINEDMFEDSTISQTVNQLFELDLTINKNAKKEKHDYFKIKIDKSTYYIDKSLDLLNLSQEEFWSELRDTQYLWDLIIKDKDESIIISSVTIDKVILIPYLKNAGNGTHIIIENIENQLDPRINLCDVQSLAQLIKDNVASCSDVTLCSLDFTTELKYTLNSFDRTEKFLEILNKSSFPRITLVGYELTSFDVDKIKEMLPNIQEIDSMVWKIKYEYYPYKLLDY